ncbi:oxygenase MpaB family protein [Galactobacter valiniphilus]|uniref:oxygenase MpaB family protein n=1 Tax=Galactobacter valiniphilus TaxID=2676122 RepID=UPI0037363206
MAFDPLARLRRTLHLTFGGSEAVPEWQYELERGEDGGYFAPHSAVWSVHGGMTPIAAGVRALLVQALHPGALAGVAEHSNYERDALGRLAGTIRWIFTVTYGSTDAARRACEHARKLHVPVRGQYAGVDGEPTYYSANSPHLGLWVHCAFADAFLRAYEEHRGPVPVPPDALPGESGADAYVREWAVAGELMGVQDPPRSEAALVAALEGFDERGELRCDERTLRVVGFIRRPPLDPSLRSGYALLFRGAVDSLSPRWRELLGLRGSGFSLPRLPRAARAAAAAPAPAGLATSGASTASNGSSARRRVETPWVGRLGAGLVLRLAGATLVKVGPAELSARARMKRVGAHGM